MWPPALGERENIEYRRNSSCPMQQYTTPRFVSPILHSNLKIKKKKNRIVAQRIPPRTPVSRQPPRAQPGHAYDSCKSPEVAKN